MSHSLSDRRARMLFYVEVDDLCEPYRSTFERRYPKLSWISHVSEVSDRLFDDLGGDVKKVTKERIAEIFRVTFFVRDLCYPDLFESAEEVLDLEDAGFERD